jgi:hypothetical protein
MFPYYGHYLFSTLNSYIDLLQTRSKKEKIIKKSKILVGPKFTAAETAFQSSPDVEANLHKMEAAKEILLLGKSTEYTVSQVYRSAPTPTTQPHFQHRQPEQCSDFHQTSPQKISTRDHLLKIKRVNNIIISRRRRCASDSCTGLPSLSVGVRVDLHQRMKEFGRSYSPATLSPLGKVSRRAAMLLLQNLTTDKH